jgi:hypothetical protein
LRRGGSVADRSRVTSPFPDHARVSEPPALAGSRAARKRQACRSGSDDRPRAHCRCGTGPAASPPLNQHLRPEPRLRRRGAAARARTRARADAQRQARGSPVAGPAPRRAESPSCLCRVGSAAPAPRARLRSSGAWFAAIGMSPTRSCDARRREDKSDRADRGGRTIEIGRFRN